MKAAFSKLFTKKNIFRLLIALFSVVFLVSAGFLADYIIGSVKQKQQFNELSNMLQQGQQQTGNNQNSVSGSDSVDYTIVIHPKTGETMKILTEYAPIFTLNPDLIGWIKVNNTIIDYPVMQTPDWENYYLKRDFYGTYSKHGTIYVTETADVKAPSDNMTIYGHKMNDGTMFADLLKYKDQEFFKQNPTITFNTIYDYREYQILSVFVIVATEDTYFPYYTFVDGDAHQFEDYVKKCKALSIYDTGIDAVDGDKLITLSTCDHVIKNGRFVIVAKQIK
ncbi:MAG: class B sortase [Oscillospiraceae bacterium]|nr:class B sortase [Oscillospiraceae bacterium]